MKRKCPKCKIRKTVGTQPYCILCKREYDRDYYHKTISKRRELRKVSTKKIRNRNAEFVFEYLKCHPCVDCGETNPIVLDFDHKGNKISTISNLCKNAVSIDMIKNEINKCEIRCANCHRIRTAKENNWYIYSLTRMWTNG